MRFHSLFPQNETLMRLRRQIAQQIGRSFALARGMKSEIAFLRYRREVVLSWPESPRKTLLLLAIESRLKSEQSQAGLRSARSRISPRIQGTL